MMCSRMSRTMCSRVSSLLVTPVVLEMRTGTSSTSSRTIPLMNELELVGGCWCSCIWFVLDEIDLVVLVDLELQMRHVRETGQDRSAGDRTFSTPGRSATIQFIVLSDVAGVDHVVAYVAIATIAIVTLDGASISAAAITTAARSLCGRTIGRVVRILVRILRPRPLALLGVVVSEIPGRRGRREVSFYPRSGAPKTTGLRIAPGWCARSSYVYGVCATPAVLSRGSTCSLILIPSASRTVAADHSPLP